MTAEAARMTTRAKNMAGFVRMDVKKSEGEECEVRDV